MEINYKTSKNAIKKIVDENTIKEITTAKLLDLPFKKLNSDEDKRWNARKINSELLQAIEQGEDIKTMSERFLKIKGMNEVSAIRNARTMTTSFENLGRLDGMKKMKENGTILKKKWLATNDSKTRDAHIELDGVTAEIDEPFHNSEGDIMYPADPSASPANVYNCRCTLVYEIKGFESTAGKLSSGYINLDAKEKATKGKLRANRNDDIQYYAPDNKYKKAIASSTIATKDNIGFYAQYNKNLTVRQLYERYPEYDTEAWGVLKSYMNKGYGDYKAYKLFDYGMSEDELLGNVKGYKAGKETFYGWGHKILDKKVDELNARIKLTNEVGVLASSKSKKAFELVKGYKLDLKEKETAGELKLPKEAKYRSLGVDWHIPGKKRPIYRSTKSTSDEISLMAEANPKATIKELYEGTTSFNTESWKVLKAYINKGYGDEIASKLFKYK